ncbi:MAG: ATP-dependent zinc metalloprotease FtsH, partial [Acidimicrobiales bacterium]
LIYGEITNGAADDLAKATEIARKMVREWGMSDRIGPMAWGSQGQVFLGEDIMHTREYSDETARIIDEEVEKVLREQEDRCRMVLTENRGGLDLVASALLQHETIDGAEVRRLVQLGREGARPEEVEFRGVPFQRVEQTPGADGETGAEAEERDGADEREAAAGERERVATPRQ